MKSIKYIVAALVIAGLASRSYATITVAWQTATTTYLSDSTGAAGYLSGDLDEVGVFATTPTQGSSSLAGFTVFATDLTGTGANVGIVGGGDAFASGSGTAGATFNHKQIYFVEFNAPTAGAATQEGIFYVNDLDNGSWQFPADTDAGTTTTFDLGSFFTDTAATEAAGATVVFGSVGVDGSGPYNILETAVVPEPSSIALVVLGLLGGIGMIRRRRS